MSLLPAPAESLQFTVRDLLVDADRTARQLLSRPSASAGSSLLAGWDAVLTAAGDLVAALETQARQEHGDPVAPTGGSMTAVGHLVDQLAAETRAMNVDQVPSRVHPDLERLIHTWQQAAAVPVQEQQRGPSEPGGGALLRVTRTLATLAHATHHAVTGYGTGVNTLSRDEADGLHRLLQRHEQMTLRTAREVSNEVSGEAGLVPHAAVVPLGATPPTAAVVQLTEHLRIWGRLATEAAANPETPQRDLRRIAQTEALMTAGVPVLLAAAARRGEIPAHVVPHLHRRLTAAGEQWTKVADQWGWLRRRGIAPPATQPTIRLTSPSATPATTQPATQATTQQVLRTSHELAQAMSGAVQTLRRESAGPPGTPAGGDRAAGPARAGALVAVLEQINENSAILAEVYARLPARALRRDSTGQLRPTLFAPYGIQHGISEAYPRRYGANAGDARETPDARESGALFSVPALGLDLTSDLAIPGRQRTDLRAITPGTTAFLLDSGADLARAATSAEQALSVVVGTSRLAPTHPAAVAQVSPVVLTGPSAPPAHSPRPAPPHSPRPSSPGTGFDR